MRIESTQRVELKFDAALTLHALVVALILPATVLATSSGRRLWAWVYFGFSLGFYVQTTWRETDSQQSDIKELGLNAWILLPACHVLVVAWICGLLAGNQAHFTTALRHSNQIVRTTLDPSTDRRAWNAVAFVWHAQVKEQQR